MNPRSADTVVGATLRPAGARACWLARAWVYALACGLSAAGLVACSSPPAPPANAAHLHWQAQQQAGAKALQRGDLPAARAAYVSALAAAESVEDFDAAGSTLLNLAAVLARLGQGAAAHATLDRVLLAPQRFSGALQNQAAARKALLHGDAGADAEALQWAQRAQSGCPVPCAVAPAMDNLRAHVALARGDWAAANAAAQRATEGAAALRLTAEQANGLRLAGRAALGAGGAARAAQVLAQALKIDQTLGLPERIALDLQYAAQAEAQRGQWQAARELYARAAVVREAAGDAPGAQALRAQAARVGPPAPR